MPLVSVVIATFRRPADLTLAIASVLAQTMADLEVIVVVERDDPESVQALAAIADARVRHVVNPVKNGPGPARDAGAEASAGKWVAFLDDDDLWLPEKLEKQLAGMTDPDRTISMTLSRVVMPYGSIVWPTVPYENDQPIDEWLFGRRTWFKGGESFLQTSSLMFPRAVFERLRFGSVRHEEWELVIRAVKQLGFRLETVAEPLVVYYTGNLYALNRSLEWVDSVRGLITRRAYSGFCLTVATHGVKPAGRNRAFATLLRMALRDGSPTLRQLFAFFMIWLVPDTLRHRVRVALGGRGASG